MSTPQKSSVVESANGELGRPAPLKIGFSNGIFRGEPLDFVLKVARLLEIDWLELKPYLFQESMEEAQEILQRVKEEGRCPKLSIHSSYNGISLAEPTDEGRATHFKEIDFARAVGSDRVVFHAGYSSTLASEDTYDRVAQELRAYLNHSADQRLWILLENASSKPGKLGSNPSELLKILMRVEDERVGATLDVVNFIDYRGERYKKVYKSLLRYVRHLQVNTTPIYQGKLKLKEFVKYFFKELKLKKSLKKAGHGLEIPVILEGKTSLARELVFYHELRRKLV